MTIATEQDQLEPMYEVARDDELDVLDALADRAGLRWTCSDKPEHSHPWTNYPDERCGRCDRTQVEAAAFDEQAGAR